ncbi:MAG: hypothetical protein R8N50_02580 [Alphaproteobacteria bacterium]|nr:hypothetical protein [Alphaproteobacteria bacterium]
MNKLWNFIKSHQHAITWTLCYILITWAILHFLFNFSIFSSAQWHHLMRAQLRGFPGFVFGIMLLAAIPLYIATTTLIVRTKKPLITIPIPKIKMPTFLQSPPPAPEPAPEPTPTTATTSPTPTELPSDMPAELRSVFIRNRNNLGRIQTSVFNDSTKITPQEISDPTQTMVESIPVPSDFDLDLQFNDTPDSIPTFTEIDFESDISDAPAEQNNNTEIINHLTKNGHPYSVDGDTIITDTHAITTHSDPDFWVADTENWFAAGRICPSPIVAVQTAAQKHNRIPVIYLATNNILDIDKLIPEWESAGITVITDLSEL